MFVSNFPPHILLLPFVCRYFSWMRLLRSVPFNADCCKSFEADYKSKLAINFSPWRRKKGAQFRIAPHLGISTSTWTDPRVPLPHLCPWKTPKPAHAYTHLHKKACKYFYRCELILFRWLLHVAAAFCICILYFVLRNAVHHIAHVNKYCAWSQSFY